MMAAGDTVEQPEHPGIQCHEAHPGIPHRFVDGGGLEPLRTEPTARDTSWMPPMPGQPLAQVGQIAPDWSRFDEWATRALEFLGQENEQVGDDRWQRLQEKARLCVDLASAASPNGIGTMPRIEMGEM